MEKKQWARYVGRGLKLPRPLGVLFLPHLHVFISQEALWTLPFQPSIHRVLPLAGHQLSSVRFPRDFPRDHLINIKKGSKGFRSCASGTRKKIKYTFLILNRNITDGNMILGPLV